MVGKRSSGRINDTQTTIFQSDISYLLWGRTVRWNESCKCQNNLTTFPANFKPYTYWQLFLASLPINQHLSSIFIFLAVFVRLKEGTLDPRILVWLSIACFVGGYVTWEGLEWSNFDPAQRNANRMVHIYECNRWFNILIREQDCQVVDISIPCFDSAFARTQDVKCCDVIWFYLGFIGGIICFERIAGGL